MLNKVKYTNREDGYGKQSLHAAKKRCTQYAENTAYETLFIYGNHPRAT